MRTKVVPTPTSILRIHPQVFVHIPAKKYLHFDRNHRIEIDVKLACTLTKPSRIAPVNSGASNSVNSSHRAAEYEYFGQALYDKLKGVDTPVSAAIL
jgi:hypothetical protein